MAAAVRRHLRFTVAAFTMALRRDAQFRAQAWTTILVGLVEVAVGLVPALLVFQHTEEVHGWSVGLVVAVTGASRLAIALLAAFVAANQARMTSYVRRGEMDGVLIRPVSAQWYAATRWMQPAELWPGLAGLALVVLGLAQAGLRPRVADVALALLWFAIGMVAITLVWTNLGYLAFWLESIDSLADLMAGVLAASRYPVAFFPSGVRTLLLVVIPIGLATTMPVSALAGAGEPRPAVVALGALVALTLLTRWHFTVAVRRYSSASS